jgi:hypothetical protein
MALSAIRYRTSLKLNSHPLETTETEAAENPTKSLVS